MKLLYCFSLFLLFAFLSVFAVSQQTPTTLIVNSGTTVNAKAVSWDEPVAVDGRVVRLRDLWVLASVLSSSSSMEPSLRIPVMQSPVSSAPDSRPPLATQRCVAGQDGTASSPECSQPVSKHPE